MTEAEWLACGSLNRMLAFLRGRISDRKLRLLMSLWARSRWEHPTEDRNRHSVIAGAEYPGGALGANAIAASHRAGREVTQEALWEIDIDEMIEEAQPVRLFRGAHWAQVANEAAHSPFHPALAWDEDGEQDWRLREALRDLVGNPFQPTHLEKSWRLWNDGTPMKIAQAIYDDHRFTDLPILADALEDAGCTDRHILDHCRSGGEHVRGCWVVDLLLGKE
jgi:hypothetical protein